MALFTAPFSLLGQLNLYSKYVDHPSASKKMYKAVLLALPIVVNVHRDNFKRIVNNYTQKRQKTQAHLTWNWSRLRFAS